MLRLNFLQLPTKLTLLVIVSATCIGSAIVAPSFPFIANYFNLISNQATFLVSVYLFGYLFGQIINSFLCKLFNYKWTLLVGFATFILSSLIQIIGIKTNEFDLFCCGRMLSAVGSSSGLICAFSMINEYSDKNETHKLIFLAFMSLTISSYLFISIGGLITNYYGFNTIFYVILSLSIFQFFLILNFIPNFKNTSKYKLNFKTILNTYFHSLINPKLIFSSIIIAFTTTSTYIYNATVSSISYNIFLISPKSFGLFSILVLLTLLFGGFISSVLSKKIKIYNIIMLGIYVSAIPLFSLYMFHNYIFSMNSQGYLFFFLVSILNIGLGLIYPSASYVALNSINCSTTASSIMNFIKIASPAVVIYIISRSNISLIDSYQTPLFVFYALTLLSGVIIKWMDKG